MNSNNYETYADAVNGKAGVAVPPTATNEAVAVPLVAEASARSDVVEKCFEIPKKYCRSGIIGKENQSSTSICNTNVYGVLDNDELNESELVIIHPHGNWRITTPLESVKRVILVLFLLGMFVPRRNFRLLLLKR